MTPVQQAIEAHRTARSNFLRKRIEEMRRLIAKYEAELASLASPK